MPSILPVSPVFGYSNGVSSEITTVNQAVEAKCAFEQYSKTFGVTHTKNGALNTGSVNLVLNIKTGYISPQLHIIFDDDFTTKSTRITNKFPDNWDNLFKNHRELPPGEFQFRIVKQCTTPTDR